MPRNIDFVSIVIGVAHRIGRIGFVRTETSFSERAAIVSVVMSFLNMDRFIAESIESVLAQTFQDWELILVDDGSTDGSTAIAKKFAERYAPRIRYEDHPGHRNRGTSASRNLGVQESNGAFLAFIDADDVWIPEKLAEQLVILEERPAVALVAGSLLYWSSWEADADKQDRLVLTGNLSNRLLMPPEASLALYPLARTPGAGVDFLVRREAFDSVGGFEEGFRGMYDDQALLAKIFLDYPVFISDRPWIKYRQHTNSQCSIAQTTGTDITSGWEYFKWFQSYLRQGRRRDPAVYAALRSAKNNLRMLATRRRLKNYVRPYYKYVKVTCCRRLN